MPTPTPMPTLAPVLSPPLDAAAVGCDEVVADVEVGVERLEAGDEESDVFDAKSSLWKRTTKPYAFMAPAPSWKFIIVDPGLSPFKLVTVATMDPVPVYAW